MRWLSQAACKDEDPELFFPIGTAAPALRDEHAAKRVCARCPVIDPCLTWALRTGQASGIWGGTNADERLSMLRDSPKAGPRHPAGR